MSSVLPFSNEALLYVLSSELLNPCAYELRRVEDKGSIKKTLEAAFTLGHNDRDKLFICADRKKRAILPLYSRLPRAFALMITAFAVQIFFPPVGLLYHLTQAISLVAIKIIEKAFNISNADCRNKKINAHLFAALKESIRILSIFFSFGYLQYLTAVRLPIPQKYDRKHDAFLRLFFLSDKEFISFIKTRSLRENLGIVGTDGNFCKWDAEEDFETPTEGHFRELYRLKLTSFAESVMEFNNSFRQYNDQIPYHNPLSESTIKEHIELLKSSGKYSNHEVFNEWIAVFKIINNECEYLEKTLLDLYGSDQAQLPHSISQSALAICFNGQVEYDEIEVEIDFESESESMDDYDNESMDDYDSEYFGMRNIFFPSPAA